ncbi:MAG TPA: signal peptidase I [Lachnospiraceae bacterium]|nr:signal peptidase I [Lachnospiraceae bacterium]
MNIKNKNKKQTAEEVIKERYKRAVEKSDIISFVEKLIFFLFLIWLLFGAVFGFKVVTNDDMKPRISADDLLIYYRLNKTYRANDVIIFQKDNVQYIGRIVGVGGDKIEIDDDGSIKINDSVIGEDNIYYATKPYDEGITFPVTLKEDEFFILCDYREGAKDSRYFGPVNTKEVMGKIITVLRRNDL